MTQEVVAETATFGGTLDEPGDVGHDELGGVARTRGASPDAHHSEVRHEGGEGIVGDLRTRRRDARDERRLTDVGKTDQRHVGVELQLEIEPELFAGFSLLGEGRRATLIREETRVALPAEAALGGEPAVPGTSQVDQERAARVVDHRADRHAHDDVLPAGAVLALGGAVLTVGAAAKGVIAKAQQRGLIVVGL